MLSKAERNLLEEKKEFNDGYRRQLVCRLKRKAEQMRHDLKLIEAYLQKYDELKRERLVARGQKVREWWHRGD
jgi:hypothetical protein